MLEIEYLAVQGFKCFNTDSIMTFGGSGFYLLTGDNAVEPRISPNGAGKSSIWDALSWVFFGKTVRGMKGKEVVNWSNVSLTSVFVRFKVDGKRYEVARTYNPISLTLAAEGGDPKVVEQAAIETLIGFNHTSFLSVALMGQFNKMFFDMPPADKLLLFSEAMDLGYWLRVSKAAADKCKQQADDLSRITSAVQQVSGEIDAVVKQQEQVEKQMATWDEMHAAAIADVAAFVTLSEKEVSKAKENAVEAKGLHAKRMEVYEAGVKEEREASDAVGQARSDVDKFLAARSRAKQEKDAVQTRIEKLKSLKGDCPTCQQPITEKHVKGAVGTLENQVLFIGAEWHHQKPAFEKAETDMEKALDRHTKAKAKVFEKQGLANEAARDMQEWEKKLAIATTQLRHHRDRLKAAEAESSPLTDTLASLSKRLRVIREEQARREEQQKGLEEKVAVYTQLADRFKEVRLWIIDEALAEFELEVNNSLLQLGLEGWSVHFDVERENSAGGVTKGFTVLVTSPTSTEPAPWMAWSGGETQRLRIAGAIGLSRLITKRRGLACNLEVWDEPTAHLSESGIVDLLAFFRSRSQEEDRQIWLVDHRSLHHGGFDGVIVVKRSEDGSKIMQGKPQ